MSQVFSLANKKILITGASSGIGRQCAISFSADGAQLFLNGRDLSRLQDVSALCPNSKIISADISSVEGREKIIAEIDSLDGVVLSAGISRNALLKFASDDDIDSIFETNTISQIKFVRDLVKQKRLNKSASIVCLASVAGVISRPAQFAYASSKAAIIGFCKSAAVDLSPRKIRINAVSPALVKTPMNQEFMEKESELCAADAKKYLLGHGEAESIANTIHFLLSDASTWITGTNILVDGGYSCHK